ncbi:hypothetical protein ACH4U6_31510 [Streptomyces netropsis]
MPEGDAQILSRHFLALLPRVFESSLVLGVGRGNPYSAGSAIRAVAT